MSRRTRYCCWTNPMPDADSRVACTVAGLRYNRSVTRWALTIASVMLPFASGAQEAAELQSAFTHLQQGESAQTIRECKAVLAANPASAPAHMLLGQAYLARGDIAMIAEAKAELQQALDLDPGLIW